MSEFEFAAPSDKKIAEAQQKLGFIGKSLACLHP